MKLNLFGKSVLITGGSKGLGLAMARCFAAEGCDLHLAARSQALLEDAAAAIRRQHGVKVNTVVVDLAQPGSAGRRYRHPGQQCRRHSFRLAGDGR